MEVSPNYESDDDDKVSIKVGLPQLWSFNCDQCLYYDSLTDDWWPCSWFLVGSFTKPRPGWATGSWWTNRQNRLCCHRQACNTSGGLSSPAHCCAIFLCYLVGKLTTSSPTQPSFSPLYHAQAMLSVNFRFFNLSEPKQLRYWRNILIRIYDSCFASFQWSINPNQSSLRNTGFNQQKNINHCMHD